VFDGLPVPQHFHAVAVQCGGDVFGDDDQRAAAIVLGDLVLLGVRLSPDEIGVITTAIPLLLGLALHGLTRNVALDYGPKGIRANCIAPGAIFSKVTEARLDEEEARSIRDNYVLGRWGAPQDVANAAMFLASDEASFITGVILPVDGGLTIQTPESAVRKSFRARWRNDIVSIRDA